MLYDAIKKLVQYGINTGITPESERIYTTNLLLDLFHEDNYEDVDCDLNNLVLEDILAELLDIAAERGIIENSIGYRDLFDTKLMNTLMPRPSQIQQTFWEKYKVSPETATDYYYKLSQDSDYIRRYRIAKDRKWTVDTKYGTLDITIIFPNQRKIQKRLQQQEKQNPLPIQNVSSVWKTKDMQDALIIRLVRTTESSRSQFRITLGDSSTPLMYTITNTASYSTDSMFQ